MALRDWNIAVERVSQRGVLLRTWFRVLYWILGENMYEFCVQICTNFGCKYVWILGANMYKFCEQICMKPVFSPRAGNETIRSAGVFAWGDVDRADVYEESSSRRNDELGSPVRQWLSIKLERYRFESSSALLPWRVLPGGLNQLKVGCFLSIF